MIGEQEEAFEAWFVHDKLILDLLTPGETEQLLRRLPGSHSELPEARRRQAFEEALAAFLGRVDVPAIDVVHLQGTLTVGQLVWFEQAIPFKGFGTAREAADAGRPGLASFSAALATDKAFKVRASYNVARATCSSAANQLSGTKRQFVLGYVQDLSTDQAELRVIAIASRWQRPTPHITDWHPVEPGRIWPSVVDQFAGVDFSARLRMTDLKPLKELPEQKVKEAFADVLGEPFVPKDWGGEQFDLWTANRLTVLGQNLRTAVAFKGPAAFHPMTIADLGKNGDQIDRLAQTAADLLVVQHCHVITAPVENMLRVYASDPRRPRRYMTIDGFQTLMILRHFGHLP